MKEIKKRISTRNSPVLILCLILIFGALFSVSCKKKAVGPTPQVPDLQAKVDELQKELTGKDAEISRLNEENARLQRRLPSAYEVEPGDNHWQIGYDYLTTKRGVSAKEAERMLANAYLLDPLLVGFKVWNFMDDGQYGSFVMQGSAKACPGSLIRVDTKKMAEEKLKLENEIARLKEEIEKQSMECKAKIEKLEGEREELKSQIDSLNQQVASLQSQNTDLDSRLNSVYYLVDVKKELKADGKIKGTFLGLSGMKIKQVSFEDFKERVDLRETDRIELRAQDFNLSAIKKVGLLPKHIKKDIDYRIEIAGDGQSASVILKNKDKFLLARIVLYVK
jgi:predicted RNase H-like nuclease (RuvC/YqgF family)